MAVVLGAGLAFLPAAASSETTPTVNATEEAGYTETSFHWTPSQVEVASGGMVRFANGSMTVPHGIVWSGGPDTPVCEASVPVGATSSGTNWSGACTFAQSGTYTFYCSVHGPKMSGTVVVSPTGTTTTSTATIAPPGTTTTTSTTSPTAPPASGSSPLAGTASHALELAKSQRGGSVKGLIDISQAGAGERLEIDVFAKTASLAKSKHDGRVRVGRFVRNSVPSGMVSFSVKLDSKARRALKRRHRLVLTIKVTLTPSYGEAVTIIRSVVEHA